MVNSQGSGGFEVKADDGDSQIHRVEKRSNISADSANEGPESIGSSTDTEADRIPAGCHGNQTEVLFIMLNHLQHEK